MRFASDSQRRAVFARMNSFSQVNPSAAKAATAESLVYPPLVRSEFALGPVESYDVERAPVGVQFNFPVNTKRYYDGRIYVYTGEASTLMKALEEMAPSMSMEDSAKAKVIAEDLGSEIAKRRLEGKDSDGMIFLNDSKLDFVERIFGKKEEFSMDPTEAEAIAKDVKYWADMDKETGVGNVKPDIKHARALRLDLKLKKVLKEQEAAKPVAKQAEEDYYDI